MTTIASGAGVATYRGDVAPGDLGVTLMHEHVFVRSPELDTDYPDPEWSEAKAVETAVRGLEALYDLGIRTVVDLTVPGLGRDVALVARVAERVRVNLIAASGWYTDEVLPPYFRTHGPGRLVGGPDPLTGFFRRDVTEGIGGSDVRAAVLKVVTDAPGITDAVGRILTAAASVHGETGVPISTHSNPALHTGLEQARFLLTHGVDPRAVVIGHSGDSAELPHLLELLDLGVTLGFDRFGMAHTGSDRERVAMLLALLARGYADQLVLSHDAAFYSRVTPPSWRRSHTPEWTHDHLSRRILPELLAQGVRQEQLDQMMVRNPAQLLTPEPSADPRAGAKEGG